MSVRVVRRGRAPGYSVTFWWEIRLGTNHFVTDYPDERAYCTWLEEWEKPRREYVAIAGALSDST